MNGAALSPGRLAGTIAVVARNLRVWRRFFASSMIGNLAEPFFYLLAFGYGLGALITDVGGISYTAFFTPGLVISTSMYAATFEGTYGTFTRLSPQRTFEGILATPVSVREVVLGEILYATIKAVAGGIAVLGVVAVFGLVSSPAALLMPVLCALVGLLFAGLAVLVSGLSPTYDFFTYYFTLVITPLFMFSGIFFPLNQLPLWVQLASWFNPLTHATDAARALFAGNLDQALLLDLTWLAAVSILPVLPATSFLRRRLVH
jgi:lipooligosaccharide transport system permease protein